MSCEAQLTTPLIFFQRTKIAKNLATQLA